MHNVRPTIETLIRGVGEVRAAYGRLCVVKLGGSAMEEPESLHATLQDVAFLAAVGCRPVVVHGGGKPIDRAMSAAGVVPRKVQGRRVTDDATLAIVVRTLCDQVNADIVRQLQERNCEAVGLHTGTTQALFGEKLLTVDGNGEAIDLGRVGRVTRVDPALIHNLTAAVVTPVIPSLAYDAGGQWLNVNADDAAAAVGVQLRAEAIVFISDTPGVLRDRADPASQIPTLTQPECDDLVRAGVIDGGMIPKVEGCLDCLRRGVKRVSMIDGRVPHALLAAALGAPSVGTVFKHS